MPPHPLHEVASLLQQSIEAALPPDVPRSVQTARPAYQQLDGDRLLVAGLLATRAGAEDAELRRAAGPEELFRMLLEQDARHVY